MKEELRDIAQQLDIEIGYCNGASGSTVTKAISALRDAATLLEQAEKDSAILEWMQKQYLCADFQYGEPATEAIVIEIPRGSRVCGNLRQDIQAAMTKESAQ